MTDIEAVQSAAQAHSNPNTFNFLDRLADRDYPTKVIDVYLDERSGHKIQELLAQRESAMTETEIDRIDADLALWRKKAQESMYRVHMEGISTESYDELIDLSREQFPLEYRESRNPLTMEVERFLIENEDRETFLRGQMWSKFIRKIEDPSGATDENITPAFVSTMMKALPIIAQIRIAAAVEELRMTTDWMDRIQDADFLANS